MILYKKDTKGKTRFLDIMFEDDKLIQISWILGTASPITATKVCKAKNVGRSNATSPQQQAIIEANALYKDKLTKGYFASLEELEEQNWDVLLPMLAKDYNKEKDKIDWNTVSIQPKLDWMRCLIIIKDGIVKMISRQWKEITTCPHISESMVGWSNEYNIKNIVLDGELYAHGFSFQENMEMVKKYRPWKTDKFVKFHCYDIVSEKRFRDRFHTEKRITWTFPKETVETVHTMWITTEEGLQKHHAINIEEGYEGSIVRWWNEGYKANGRSSNLLKYKDFLDEAYEVADVEPSDARPSQGVLVLRTASGESFKASLKMSFEERERILRDKLSFIGKMAEIRFFEFTDWGLPRFPVCVGFRLDK